MKNKREKTEATQPTEANQTTEAQQQKEAQQREERSGSRREFLGRAAAAGLGGLGFAALAPQPASGQTGRMRQRDIDEAEVGRAQPRVAEPGSVELFDERNFDDEGPWIVARTSTLKEYVRVAQTCAAEPDSPDPQDIHLRRPGESAVSMKKVLQLQRETIRQLDQWQGPMAVVNARFLGLFGGSRNMDKCCWSKKKC